MAENLAAMTNRSLRTIKTELEFLADVSCINPEQLANLLDQLPDPTSVRAPNTTARTQTAIPTISRAEPVASTKGVNGYSPAVSPAPAAQQPPPAYPVAPAPPTQSALTYATALYTYTPTDTGDLALSPQDRVAVTEYMNAEWWKGRSERTGAEGIFPRAYVRVEEKLPAPAQPPRPASTSGNMPLEVSQSGDSSSRQPSKTEERTKRVGKRFGEAAVFGAGATVGSGVIRAIF